MARIFLSHSSENNAEAVALGDWLASEGWDDLFLDLDPERGIVAGERWERALNAAASRCEAVLFLASRAWLSSDWCMKEFNLAHRLNKRLFGLLIEDIPLAELPANLTSTWQLVRLASGRDHQMFHAILPVTGEEAHVTFSAEGLTRLRAGLLKAGLDARYFAWPPERDPDRPPYRGMRPLEAEDAGIFFGRDAPIVDALDRLRGLREAAPPRLLVILGASGAGKSSFLRAGLMPRLQRDDRHFLPLPVIRPERAAISGETGFVRSLEEALKAKGLTYTRAQIKETVANGAEAVRRLLSELVAKAHVPDVSDDSSAQAPTLVLAIDQGEELVQAEGAEEAKDFLTLLKDLLLAQAPDLIVLGAVRSESYESLQTVPVLDGIKQDTFSLTSMPKGAYKDVIEGPAHRLAEPRKLTIEPQLTAALLEDIEKGGAKDALPLLAFTLERLYLDYGGDGDLKLFEYEQLGRIKGAIEAAVEDALSAADSNPNIPKDRGARLALLRRGLIPWLAGIDPETDAPRRRVARLSEIPEEARPLIDLLTEQRLLTTDVAKGTREVTIEPAHEALLRQWGLLEGWLKEDVKQLRVLEGIKRAARDWDAHAKDDEWLAHTGKRLDEAERVATREDFATFVAPTERAYLAAARARKQAELLRRARVRKGVVAALSVLVVLVLSAAVVLNPYTQTLISQWTRSGTITVEGKPFMESSILIELMALMIEKEGDKNRLERSKITVTRKHWGGENTELLGNLLQGTSHLLPDYTGTLLVQHLKMNIEDVRTANHRDDDWIRQNLDKSDYGDKLVWLDGFGYESNYALVMLCSRARELGLLPKGARPDAARDPTISDLARVASDLARVGKKLSLGAEDNFRERKDGLPGLIASYPGFADMRQERVSHERKYEDLKERDFDVTDAYTTDPELYDMKKLYDMENCLYIELIDDQGFFIKYYAGPLVRRAMLRAYPEVKTAMDQLAGKISEGDMAGLLRKADKEEIDGHKLSQGDREMHDKLTTLCQRFLNQKGLLGPPEVSRIKQ